MTRFYLRAAYTAVLMASMSFAGHVSAMGNIGASDFGDSLTISGENIEITTPENNIYVSAVSLPLKSSNRYLLETTSGGSIKIAGVFDGVSVANGNELIIGSDHTHIVEITSTSRAPKPGKANATLLAVQNGSEIDINAEEIKIHGVLNKNNDGDNSTTIYGLLLSSMNDAPGSIATIGGSSTELIEIDVSSDRVATGVKVGQDGMVSLDAKSIQISGSTHAIESNTANIQIGSDVTENLTLQGGYGFLGSGVGSSTVLNGKIIEVLAKNRAVSNTDGVMTVGSGSTETITMTGDAEYAVFNQGAGASVTLDAKSIALKGGTSAGVAAVYNDTGSVAIGSENTELVSITASAAQGVDEDGNTVTAAGLSTTGYGTTTVQGRNVSIQSEDAGVFTKQGTTNITAEDTIKIASTGEYGVLVQGNDESMSNPNQRTTTKLSAKDIVVTAENGVGLGVFSYGKLDIDGNLDVRAETAIDTRGNSETNINTEGKDHTVNIVGDIVFETPGAAQGSGSIVNSTVNLKLTNADSSWTGNAVVMYPGNLENIQVDGMNLALENGAQWNVTNPDLTISAPDGTANVPVAAVQNINSLNLSGGVINMDAEDAPESVSIDKLEGTGGTINARAVRGTDGSLTTSNVTVGEVAEGSSVAMAVYYKGITSDALTAENTKDLKALDIVSGAASVSEYVEEGDINGAWTRQDGEGDGSFQANTKLTDFSSVNAMSLVQWRNEINHLTKRLGDIRASEGTIGAWARVYGGESQWGGANEVEMDHTTIQVGGDYRINNHWVAGAAFSYTDSRADLGNGDADGDSYSLAVYGTYTADGGSFLDVIGRYGYLKNDISAGNMALDTSSSAFSLSAEMGHTFRFINDAAYVEPQIEFTYGFIGGDDATASNSVRIDQDDFQSFVTRVGVRAGYDFPQKKGSFYGMFSYSYDWMGDADGTASKGDLRQALSQDLGGGWVTYGVGAQIMLGDSAYFYGELERTSGGDIDNPYLFSAGVRMTF